MAQLGEKAPEFNLRDHNGQQVALSQYKGQKYVVLHIFPAAFTGGWANQTSSFARANARFEEKEAQVLGLSADASPSLRAFAAGMGGVPHPLLTDFHPKGATLQAYGVYNETSGNARRSVFIIDKEGIIRWSNVYQPGTLPIPDDVLGELNKVRGS